MPKRYRSNYSLWPEQSRPRRAIPLTLAAGGFAIGIVCAVAAHNVVTDFFRSGPVLETAREATDTRIPVYATVPTAVAPASEAAEPANRTRSRLNVAKVTLPSIGARTSPNPTTDGRGGSSDGQNAPSETMAAAPLTASTPAPAASITPTAPSAVEDVKPAEEQKAEEQSSKAKRERRSKAYARAKQERAKAYASRRSRDRSYAGYGGSPYYGYRQSRQSYGGSGFGFFFARQQY